MARSKYTLENSVVMKAGYRQLVQQTDFDDESVKLINDTSTFHIYMICSRPKIRISTNGLVINKNTYSISYDIIYSEGIKKETFKHENKLGFYSYELNRSGSRLLLKDKNGKIITEGKATYLYKFSCPEYNEVLDLKVLYVGQAFGSDGERLAPARLRTHSTLQMIYADFLENNPNDDIFIIMWQFYPYYISMMGVCIVNPLIGLDKSVDNYTKLLETPFPFDQQVTAVEAALIKYFSPIYNKQYKTTFPSNKHSSYNICYSLDLNSIIFELDTNSIYTRLYSENVAPSTCHIGKFFLHNKKDRRDMFLYFDELLEKSRNK